MCFDRYGKTPTNERSNTMETITATESPKVLVDEIKEQIATLEAQVNTLRDTLTRERAKVNDLYTTINADIVNNEWTGDSKITLTEVSEYLEQAFGNALTFQTEYAATVEFKVRAVVKFWAEGIDDAREIANSIELSVDDDDVEYEGDAEVSEVYVDETNVQSVREE
jgi:hypothetical protein